MPSGPRLSVSPSVTLRQAVVIPGRTEQPWVLWRSCHFITLTVATSIGLFAQIGLIAHLFSLLVPALGAHLAGFMAGLAAAFAIAGRTGLGWLLPARANR